MDKTPLTTPLAALLIATHQTRMAEAKENTTVFDSGKDEHYFEFIWSRSKNVVVRCTLCAGNKMFPSVFNQTLIYTLSFLTKFIKEVIASLLASLSQRVRQGE